MEMKAAQQIGGRQTVRSLLFVVLIVEFCILIVETRGDFANGILFYIQEQLNIFELGLFIILFVAMYLCGRNAGKEIIIHEKNYIWIGIKYSLLGLAIISILLVIVYAANNASQRAWQSLMGTILELTCPFIVIWVWAAWRIKLKGTGSNSSQP